MNDMAIIIMCAWVIIAIISAGIMMALQGKNKLADAVDTLAVCMLWPVLAAAMPFVGLIWLLSYAVIGIATIIDKLT